MGGVGLAHRRFLGPILALPRPLLLAFDVDGTLAPIVRTPSKARVPARAVRALRGLAEIEDVRLAVITGRDPESLARMLPFDGLYRGVLHGKLVLKPGVPARPLSLEPSERKALDAFVAFAEAELSGRGVWLEPKPGALGVHVRQLSQRDPGAAADVLARARERARALDLKAREGRAIVEVETRSGDKGEALSRIHRLSRARGVVFFGDDVTDLPALRYATAHGLGLFVRSAERPQRPAGLSGSLPDLRACHALAEELFGALGTQRPFGQT